MRAEKDRAGVADFSGEFFRVGGLDFEMFGRERVDQRDRLVEILKSTERPMSLRQLVPKVLETCHCNENTPAAILEMHRDLFVRLDKGIYGLREWATT